MSTPGPGHPKAADYWEFFAAEARAIGSPLYGRLCEGIAGDGELRALAAHAREGQPHANLLFAAVHFLLLRGAAHPLRAFYPDLGGAASGDPFPAFRDFALTHSAELATLIATRVTNTNEVGRSALLHPGFRTLAAQAGTPLNLIEIGPSAGLNLIWDRYGVTYGHAQRSALILSPGAPLMIACEARGPRLPPGGETPSVARRLGLELNPVDLSCADARDWLRALIWPDQTARLARLDTALALFAAHRPEIRAGDALALLPQALREMPEDQPVCIYHTIALYQFSRDHRQALDDLLTVAGLRRPVHRLSFEARPPDGRCILSLIRYHDGTRQTRDLARAHPHGTWLEWLEA